MDRAHLADLLDRDNEAFTACRLAVIAGAEFVIWDASQPASALAFIYDRRERLTVRRGTPTLGFTDAVADLRAQGEALVGIGAVKQAEPPCHFQFFLNEDATAIVACLGVVKAPSTPDAKVP